MKSLRHSHKIFLILFTLGVILTAQWCLALEPNTAMPSPLANDLRETTSLMAAIFKVTGSLAVVIGLMLLLFFLFKKFGLNKGLSAGGSLINVLESRLVAPKKYVAIIEIASKCVAVGITDTNITLLTELDSSADGSITNPGRKKETASFPSLLKKAAQSTRNKTSFVEANKEPGESVDVQ
jgi:flagellar biosynthetic protein FliO